MISIINLKVNHLPCNLSVSSEPPVFSWALEGDEKNIYQKNCRIEVFDKKERGIYDSGTIETALMTDRVYTGPKLKASERYKVKVTLNVCSEKRKNAKLTRETYFETGLFRAKDWKGVFIGETEDRVYHLYRKNFYAGEKLSYAKLYVSGLGQFEGYVNGARVSDAVLEPSWSAYDKTQYYKAYDVTALVKKSGNNCMLFKLGDGMYNVPGGRYVYWPRSYGKCRLLVQLELTYENGKKEYIVTDESWKKALSPVRFCCIYGGEDYDGRLWKKEYLLPEYEEGPEWTSPVITGTPDEKLKPDPLEPLKVMQVYPSVNVTKNSEDTYLYDFGKNFSGRPHLYFTGCAGMSGLTVKIKNSEILNSEGRADQRTCGHGDQHWSYTFSDEENQEFVPDFTYTGFRYIEVSGAVPEGFPGETVLPLPVIAKAEGEFIYPSSECAGEFSCSNEMFNRIHMLVRQAIYSNLKSYSTDCPHREKLGWMEQLHLIGPSIMYNLNVENLYAKAANDIHDSQHADGLVPDICPEYVRGFEKWHYGYLDSPEWGSSVILAAWYAYLRYGNLSVLKKHYPDMKRYLKYLQSKTSHGILNHGLGDWLDVNPGRLAVKNTPVAVVATAMYYYDIQVMKKIAVLTGNEKDLLWLDRQEEKTYTEYNRLFLDDQRGYYGCGSQAAQAMSLMSGIVPDNMKEKAIKTLKDDIKERNYAITPGDVGHPFFIWALRTYKMNDILDRIVNDTEKPGYAYQIVNGATSLTEDWDGPEKGKEHGSQNHLMLGSIEEWFFGTIGGIDLVRNGYSFGEVNIQPVPTESTDSAECSVLHPYGTIRTGWEKKNGKTYVRVVIPPNITAHLKTPDGEEVMKTGSGEYEYSF